MPRHDSSLWHTLGRALGTVMDPGSGGSTRTRRGGSRGKRAGPVDSSTRAVLGVLAGGATAAMVSGIRKWTTGHRPSTARLARGALAGAGAAGVVLAGRLLVARVGGEDPSSGPRELGDELLAGAGRGLIYAALLDPILPGPAPLRGALVGTADYFAAPLGGLFSRLQTLSPVRRIPLLSILLETGDAEDDPFLDFLAYGILLGALLGEDHE